MAGGSPGACLLRGDISDTSLWKRRHRVLHAAGVDARVTIPSIEQIRNSMANDPSFDVVRND